MCSLIEKIIETTFFCLLIKKGTKKNNDKETKDGNFIHVLSFLVDKNLTKKKKREKIEEKNLSLIIFLFVLLLIVSCAAIKKKRTASQKEDNQ